MLFAFVSPDFKQIGTLVLALIIAWLVGSALASRLGRRESVVPRHKLMSIHSLMSLILGLAVGLALLSSDPGPVVYILVMIPPITLFTLMTRPA